MADNRKKKDGDRDQRRRAQPGQQNQPEPTDTLEDRNLTGSTTWATLPDKNPPDQSA